MASEPRNPALKPRCPHHRFKWLVATEALTEPLAFAARYAGADRQARIVERWSEANLSCPGDERVAPDGLTVEALGDPESPLVLVDLPTPERPNEAYSLAMIPVDGDALGFRVFALEKAVFPKTGAPLVFLVEIRPQARDNYGPPDDHAPNDARRAAFVTAILEICDGKRSPLGSMPISLPART